MTAAPVVTPVTTPTAETVAIDGSSDDHVTSRPVSTLPSASVTVAVAWVVCPGKMLVDARLTTTFCTGDMTTMTATLVDLPSDVAVSTAVPDPRPVTFAMSPAVDTAVNIDVLSTDHVMLRPLTTWPFASNVVALACAS